MKIENEKIAENADKSRLREIPVIRKNTKI